MSEYVGFGWRDRNAKKASGRAPDPLSGNSAGKPPRFLMFHQEFDVPLHTAVKNAMTWHVVGGGSSSAMGSRMFPRANMCVHCLQLLVCVICLQRKLCYFSLFEAEYMTFQQLLLREYFCERQQLPNLQNA
jgi:hypothetical protein